MKMIFYFFKLQVVACMKQMFSLQFFFLYHKCLKNHYDKNFVCVILQ